MSPELLPAMAPSDKWLEQARRDLAAAQVLHADERFEWACFVALQAAEKALKACLDAMEMRWEHLRGRDGHDLVKLTNLWPNFLRFDDRELAEALTDLNQLSESTRYPTEREDPATRKSLGTVFPWEVYSYEDSIRAIAGAERLLVSFTDFISQKLPQLRKVMKPVTEAELAPTP